MSVLDRWKKPGCGREVWIEALLMAVSQRKRSGISRLAIGPPSFAPEHILSKTWRFVHKDSYLYLM